MLGSTIDACAWIFVAPWDLASRRFMEQIMAQPPSGFQFLSLQCGEAGITFDRLGASDDGEASMDLEGSPPCAVIVTLPSSTTEDQPPGWSLEADAIEVLGCSAELPCLVSPREGGAGTSGVVLRSMSPSAMPFITLVCERSP